MKTPKTITLLAVPVVLAAAIASATGAFAKSPAHQSAARTSAAVKVGTAAAPAAVTKPESTKATAATGSAPAAETPEPASTETDAAGGHADSTTDPNVDHQFNGEE